MRDPSSYYNQNAGLKGEFAYHMDSGFYWIRLVHPSASDRAIDHFRDNLHDGLMDAYGRIDAFGPVSFEERAPHYHAAARMLTNHTPEELGISQAFYDELAAAIPAYILIGVSPYE